MFAFNDRWTRELSREVLVQMSILSGQLPLVRAGILKFSNPVFSICTGCRDELRQRVKRAADSIIAEYLSEIDFRLVGNNIEIDAEPFDYTGLILRRRLTRTDKARLKRGDSLKTLGRPGVALRVARSVYETLLSMVAPLPADTTTILGSRASLLAIRKVGDYLVPTKELAHWEASRAMDVPWVKELTLDQVLQLREKASHALPRFRSRMASGIADTTAAKPDQMRKIVDTLREESLEVNEELRALNFGRGERFRNMAGALALTISLYGFAAEFVPAAAALTGLMSALALIHQDGRKAHHERDRLQARPGFVLLKAKELLMHADRAKVGDPAERAPAQARSRAKRRTAKRK
jgi:hypothetical protein